MPCKLYQNLEMLRLENQMILMDMLKLLGLTLTEYYALTENSYNLKAGQILNAADFFCVSVECLAGRTNNRGGINNDYYCFKMRLVWELSEKNTGKLIRYLDLLKKEQDKAEAMV